MGSSRAPRYKNLFQRCLHQSFLSLGIEIAKPLLEVVGAEGRKDLIIIIIRTIRIIIILILITIILIK